MLPKLSSLDTLLLADETKTLAEATFLKKQMYYNMRIKTMHRNARNIIRMAAEGKRVSSPAHDPQNIICIIGETPHYVHQHAYTCVHLVQAALQAWQPMVNRLVQRQKDIQRELSEQAEANRDDHQQEVVMGLEGKLLAIDARCDTLL